MPLPAALRESLTARLRDASDPAPGQHAAPPAVRARRFVRRLGAAGVRRAEAAGLLRARQAAHQANVRLDGVEQTVSNLQPVAVQAELTAAQAQLTAAQAQQLAEQLAEQAEQLEQLEGTSSHFDTHVHELTVNQELLKAELRGLQHTIDELGWALAPGAGLAGAGARVAELRERINGLDRRLRALPQPAGVTGGQANAEPATGRPAPAAREPAVPQSALFDYVGFERRFRGDPDEVSDTLWSRYGERLRHSAPVVDLGCGRAELLRRLQALGVEAKGVDSDPSMVLEARDGGLDVDQADALTWLADQPEGSLGSIIATHLVEHLQLDDLVRLLELAASRLHPGGILIAETPNPASLVVLGNSYVMDPTHVRPVHPSLLTFLLEGAGFRDVRLEFYSPAQGYHLPLVDDPTAPGWVATVNLAFGQLNHVLFGPQDYAAIATTPTSPD